MTLDRLLPLLACPICRAELETVGTGTLRCRGCDAGFPTTEAGQPDLRLRTPQDASLSLRVGDPVISPEPLPPLATRAAPEVDFSGVALPRHLGADLRSHIPAGSSPQAVALDLGCGDGTMQPTLEHAGYAYVGLDYSNPMAPLLGDAHVLPFQDESFELVVSLAVLEHLQHPALAMSEARRVLKPGGVIIGTVAFLEPFHSSSYYHHTHLGTMNSLRAGGFQVELVAPSSTWTVLRAHARKSLFPRMPARVANALVWPLLALHRLWWAAAGLRSRRSLESTRLRLTAGSYAFVARRPLLSDRA